jgi:hypothetical protein
MSVSLHSTCIHSAALSHRLSWSSHSCCCVWVHAQRPLPCCISVRSCHAVLAPTRLDSRGRFPRQGPCNLLGVLHHTARTPSRSTPRPQRKLLPGAVCGTESPPDAHSMPLSAEVAPGAVRGVHSPPGAHAEQRCDDYLQLRRQQLTRIGGRLHGSSEAHGCVFRVKHLQ